MSWWGKLVGGTFGFMLGGPLGALIGASFGHNFDRGYATLHGGQSAGFAIGGQERVQTAFFTTTFAVMGHLAKADGQVTQDEIGMARHVMGQMQLAPELQKAAMHLFNQGKQPDFVLDDVLDQFRRECRGRRNLIRMFIEIQLHAAYADGTFHPEEERILRHSCERLGFSSAEFHHLEDLVRAAREFAQGGGQGVSATQKLADAYKVLGIGEESTDAEVKRAYRRMMSQHHPDKLVAKGLPEEMMKLATEKTQEIRAAYDTINQRQKAA